MAEKFPTPHIAAEPSDFAETIIMPGDPKRSELIAREFLSAAVLVNDVRGAKGFTGKYKGKRVSVMASGMGMPSMGIYSYELFNFFGVESMIRVGSAGAYQQDIKLGELIFGETAVTDSVYITGMGMPKDFVPTADKTLFAAACRYADEKGLKYRSGVIETSDYFYTPDMSKARKQADIGVLCVEMEAAALYTNAARSGKRALAVLTVSDHVFGGESMDALKRQNSFTDMIELALEIA